MLQIIDIFNLSGCMVELLTSIKQNPDIHETRTVTEINFEVYDKNNDRTSDKCFTLFYIYLEMSDNII